MSRLSSSAEPSTAGRRTACGRNWSRPLAHVTGGQVGPAVNVLEAFQNQINAYIRSRRLTLAEGEALISAAQNIIAELEEVAP